MKRRVDKVTFPGRGTTSFNFTSPIITENKQRQRIEGSVRPIGGVAGDGPYEFIVPESATTFLHLNSIVLYGKFKILKANGTEDTVDTDVVAPINNFGIGLWDTTEVSLNDNIINGQSSPHSNYKGHLETILSYDDSIKDAHLPCQFYFPDTAGRFNAKEITGMTCNAGFKTRREITKLSKVFETMSPVTSDFLRCMNHLAPGNKLSIKLYRAKDQFVLLSKTTNDVMPEYRLKILDLKLYFNRIRVTDGYRLSSIERYPIETTELIMRPLCSGLLEAHLDIQSSGRIPKMVVVAQVLTEATNGNFSENPFYFRHFSLTSISLRVNDRNIPNEPLKTDFESANVSRSCRAFHHLFMNTGSWRVNKGTCIGPNSFMNGNTVFPFDLSPDLCNGHHLHESETGSLSLDLSWKTALTHPVTILIYRSYNDILRKMEEDPSKFEIDPI